MTRRPLAPLASAAACAISAAALLAGAAARADILDRLDQPAADVECAKWWNGPGPKLTALRGRVVVLHVSDPARITTKAFASAVRRLAETWQGKPVTLIEVAVCEEEAPVAEYVATTAPTWPVGWDPHRNAAAAYPGSSVPRTYVIGPDGQVAWHAHIGALTPDVIESQIARVDFFADPKSLPRKARDAAKAAGELRYGEALKLGEKVLADKWATPEDRDLVQRIQKEVPRYYKFLMKIVEALCADLDWAVAYRRVERMREVFRGTEFEDEVEAKWKELNANARVVWIVNGQRELDAMVAGLPKMKREELEVLARKLEEFEKYYVDTALAKKAKEWREEVLRRLAELDARKRK